MNRIAKFVMLPLLLLGIAQRLPAGQITTLHTFSSSDGGVVPMGSLIANGNTIYGFAQQGGPNEAGTIYSINTNGSGFQVIYGLSISQDGPDEGGIALSGSTIYGTGWNAPGNVFKVNTNGTGYTVLHAFTGAPDGNEPDPGPLLVGSTIYGGTRLGGTGGLGTIYKVNTDGSGYSVLYSLTGSADGAQQPTSTLTLGGSTLYGVTGADEVFRLNTDGTGFLTLATVASGADFNGLLLSGNTLYGMTTYGGTHNDGDVYKINTDGSGYSVLYSFSGPDGNGPWYSNLTIVGNTLYGTTRLGGMNSGGTIFQINTDGTDFQSLYSFPLKGQPYGGLTLVNDTLYGTTAGYGGGAGTLFSYALPEPSSIALAALAAAGLAGWSIKRRGGRRLWPRGARSSAAP